MNWGGILDPRPALVLQYFNARPKLETDRARFAGLERDPLEPFSSRIARRVAAVALVDVQLPPPHRPPAGRYFGHIGGHVSASTIFTCAAESFRLLIEKVV